MRTYEQTNPWLTFDLGLRRASPKLWTVLGKAQAGCEHIANVPLWPTTARELDERYLAKGIAATAAMGGSPITDQEVLQQIQGKLDLQPPRERFGQETANILKACREIANRLLNGKAINLDAQRLKNLNRTVLANLAVGPKVVPGEVRTHQVESPKFRAAPAEDCEFLLGRLCQWLDSECFAPPPDLEIVCGLLKAISAHVYIAWIHPFGDGNGRTARLVEFQILLEVGVPTPAAHLLSSHYNQTRHEYYHQLQQASESEGGILPFIEYAVQGLVDGLKEQLEVIRDQQSRSAWRDYIRELFEGKTGGPDIRRAQLALGLSQADGWVPVSKVRQVSGDIAQAYAGMTQKCISRDLAILEKMGVVEKKRGATRAGREKTLAFLPARRKAAQTDNVG